MIVREIQFRTACTFVDLHHRHHKRTIGHKFSLGLYVEGYLIGVAVVGRPVSRHLDDKKTLEINRLCVIPGHRNACSKLYSACAQAAKLRGFKKVITYTLMSENGASLKASNFILEKENAGGKNWTGDRKHVSTELKKRWGYSL